MLTKRERKAKATQQKILDEACYGFTVNSMNLISLDVVAYRAEVDRSTIYYHFGDKKMLFAAVVEYERVRVIRSLRTAVAHEQTASKRLEAYVKARLKHATRLAEYLKHNKKFVYGDSEVWGSFCEFAADERKLVENILRIGQARKEFAIDDTESPAKAIVDIMNGLQLLHAERGKPLVEIMESAMESVKILINGLKK